MKPGGVGWGGGEERLVPLMSLYRGLSLECANMFLEMVIERPMSFRMRALIEHFHTSRTYFH